jgi:serine/threonine-protein phosphatase PGAM5
MSPSRYLRFSLLAVVALLALVARAGAADAATGIRTLYLVRHGMADSVKGADDKTANALTALGREQAALIARRLGALPVKFDSVLTSEFARARETGDIIAAQLGTSCRRDARLNETVPAGIGLDVARFPPVAGAEAQLDAAWAHYSQPAPGAPRNDLLVCHANVIRWFVCRVLGADPSRYTRVALANASLTIITVAADGTAQLVLLNDVSHVPLARQTWLNRDGGPFWSGPDAAKPGG